MKPTDPFILADALRRVQGAALALAGLGQAESSYRFIVSGLGWRLRAYLGPESGPAVLIASAPIKRPYIWDLAPSMSAVRICVQHGLRVFLVEWTPSDAEDGPGLGECVDAIGESVARVASVVGGMRPFLMGHSLGGTLAAIYAALEPDRIRGLVLLGSPLCFRRGASPFGDALVSIVPGLPAGPDPVPGSFLSQLSALASPQEFLWARYLDAVLTVGVPRAVELHARIERWALDEVPLSGKLAGQILQLLYREDRFCRGVLKVRDKVVGPSCLRVPTLAVVNRSDLVAPPNSITHFLNQLSSGSVHLIEYPGEVGVGLQHLAVLVGRQAHAEIWPAIMSWMRDRREPDS
jgi:polyhydroxyalkanoate synthase subunit PhaC